MEVFCDLRIAISKQWIAWEMHFKAFLSVLVRSVLFQSKLWSVPTSTEVHGTFTPAETRDLRAYTCIYSCVITGHRAGQDAHMNQTLALLVYKNIQLCFALDVSRYCGQSYVSSVFHFRDQQWWRSDVPQWIGGPQGEHGKQPQSKLLVMTTLY